MLAAGQMGENVTTRGIDLLGLRSPCVQLNRIQPGLMAATLGRDDQGS